MDMKSTIKSIMREQKVTYEVLANRVGTTKSSLGNSLGAAQKSIGVEKSMALLGELGYDLAVVPKGSRLPSGAMLVDFVGGGSDG